MAKLAPIDHSEDVQYHAFSEKKEVSFPSCTHSMIQFDREKHELRCRCGVAFTGPRLAELYDALTKNSG